MSAKKYAAGKNPNSLANLAPPFKPGQSGNPGGRPKGRSITALTRDLLQQAIKGGGKHKGKTAKEALAELFIGKALEGDFRFFKELLERLEGKVADRIAGHEGGPLLDDKYQETINKVFANPKAMKHAIALANLTRNGGKEKDKSYNAGKEP